MPDPPNNDVPAMMSMTVHDLFATIQRLKDENAALAQGKEAAEVKCKEMRSRLDQVEADNALRKDAAAAYRTEVASLWRRLPATVEEDDDDDPGSSEARAAAVADFVRAVSSVSLRHIDFDLMTQEQSKEIMVSISRDLKYYLGDDYPPQLDVALLKTFIEGYEKLATATTMRTTRRPESPRPKGRATEAAGHRAPGAWTSGRREADEGVLVVREIAQEDDMRGKVKKGRRSTWSPPWGASTTRKPDK